MIKVLREVGYDPDAVGKKMKAVVEQAMQAARKEFQAMKKAKLLLEQLAEAMPPGAGQRHNLTVDESGNLVVYLMLGEHYQPAILTESDMEKPVEDLVIEIGNMVANCEDCGLPYQKFGIDATLSNEQWLTIHPERDEGLLCANCIMERASAVPSIIAARITLEISS